MSVEKDGPVMAFLWRRLEDVLMRYGRTLAELENIRKLTLKQKVELEKQHKFFVWLKQQPEHAAIGERWVSHRESLK